MLSCFLNVHSEQERKREREILRERERERNGALSRLKAVNRLKH